MRPKNYLIIAILLAITATYSSCKKGDTQPAPGKGFRMPDCGNTFGEGQFEPFNDSETYHLITNRGYLNDEVFDPTVIDSISLSSHSVYTNKAGSAYFKYRKLKYCVIDYFLITSGKILPTSGFDSIGYRQFDLHSTTSYLSNSQLAYVPPGCYRLYYIVSTPLIISGETKYKVATKGHFDISIQ